MKKWRKMSSHQVPKRKAIRPISQQAVIQLSRLLNPKQVQSNQREPILLITGFHKSKDLFSKEKELTKRGFHTNCLRCGKTCRLINENISIRWNKRTMNGTKRSSKRSMIRCQSERTKKMMNLFKMLITRVNVWMMKKLRLRIRMKKFRLGNKKKRNKLQIKTQKSKIPKKSYQKGSNSYSYSFREVIIKEKVNIMHISKNLFVESIQMSKNTSASLPYGKKPDQRKNGTKSLKFTGIQQQALQIACQAV